MLQSFLYGKESYGKGIKIDGSQQILFNNEGD